jgi:SAM-dependent methyltransferase
VFTSPRLDASERARFYDGRLFCVGSGVWAYPRLGLIGNFTSGKRLMDVGCGTWGFLDAAMKSGFDAVGVDPSAASVARSRAKGLDVRLGTKETIAVAPGSLDAVSLGEDLEHGPDPHGLMVSVRTTLAPGGIVAFSMPDFNSSGSGWLKGGWPFLIPEQNLWHFTKDAVRKTMSGAGFRTEFLTTDPLNPCNFGRLDHMAGIARKT